MATRGGVTRTCYTKIMNLFSSKILVQPFTGHVFFFFFVFFFLFFCLFCFVIFFFLLFFFFFSFFFTFLLTNFFYLCIFFPLLFLTFSYIFFSRIYFIFLFWYTWLSFHFFIHIAIGRRHRRLCRDGVYPQCNAMVRHFELSQRVFKNVWCWENFNNLYTQ